MSGLSGKPGIIEAVTYVRYVPKADICSLETMARLAPKKGGPFRGRL
jgi:hypothetical protein